MTYLIEIQNPSGALAYVTAQAETRQDAAHAVIDAQLERDDSDTDDDIVIVASIDPRGCAIRSRSLPAF